MKFDSNFVVRHYSKTREYYFWHLVGTGIVLMLYVVWVFLVSEDLFFTLIRLTVGVAMVFRMGHCLKKLIVYTRVENRVRRTLLYP